MNILSFDTCCGYFSIAVFKQDKFVSYYQSDKINQQAEQLVIKIEYCLQQANLKTSDLTHIAVSIGPGSFTGIRIGLAVAQGISIASNSVIIGITTLEAIATGIEKKVSIALDCGRDQFYYQTFDNGIAISDIEIKTLESLNDEVIVCNPKQRLNLPDAKQIAINAIRKINEEYSPINNKLQPLYVNSYF